MLAGMICIADERKATIEGYVKKLNKFKTMFFSIIAINIFRLVEKLAIELKNPKLYASDSMKAANTLNKTLLSFRTNKYLKYN